MTDDLIKRARELADSADKAAAATIRALADEVERMRRAIDEGVDIGASSLEPSLRNLIFRHYLPHMTEKAALDLTQRYVDAILQEKPHDATI